MSESSTPMTPAAYRYPGHGANADEVAAKIRELASGFTPDSEPDPATEI